MEDTEERGVFPGELDVARGVGKDVVDDGLFVESFTEEGFDDEGVGGFEVGVAGVGDFGARVNRAFGEEVSQVVVGDFGVFVGGAVSAGVDNEADAGDGFNTGRAARGGVATRDAFGEDGGVLTAFGDVVGNDDAVFDGLFLAGFNLRSVAVGPAPVFVLEGNPAGDLGAGGFVTEVDFVGAGGDGVGGGVNLVAESLSTDVFDGHGVFESFAGFKGDAVADRGDLEPDIGLFGFFGVLGLFGLLGAFFAFGDGNLNRAGDEDRAGDNGEGGE